MNMCVKVTDYNKTAIVKFTLVILLVVAPLIFVNNAFADDTRLPTITNVIKGTAPTVETPNDRKMIITCVADVLCSGKMQIGNDAEVVLRGNGILLFLDTSGEKSYLGGKLNIESDRVNVVVVNPQGMIFGSNFELQNAHHDASKAFFIKGTIKDIDELGNKHIDFSSFLQAVAAYAESQGDSHLVFNDRAHAFDPSTVANLDLNKLQSISNSVLEIKGDAAGFDLADLRTVNGNIHVAEQIYVKNTSNGPVIEIARLGGFTEGINEVFNAAGEGNGMANLALNDAVNTDFNFSEFNLDEEINQQENFDFDFDFIDNGSANAEDINNTANDVAFTGQFNLEPIQLNEPIVNDIEAGVELANIEDLNALFAQAPQIPSLNENQSANTILGELPIQPQEAPQHPQEEVPRLVLQEEVQPQSVLQEEAQPQPVLQEEAQPQPVQPKKEIQPQRPTPEQYLAANPPKELPQGIIDVDKRGWYIEVDKSITDRVYLSEPQTVKESEVFSQILKVLGNKKSISDLPVAEQQKINNYLIKLYKNTVKSMPALVKENSRQD